MPVPVLPEVPPLVPPVPEVEGLVVVDGLVVLLPLPTPVELEPVPVLLPALLSCWRRQSSFAVPVRPTQLVLEPELELVLGLLLAPDEVLSLGLVVEDVLGLLLDPAELLSLGLVVLELGLLAPLLVESLPAAIARPVIPRNAAATAAPRIFCFIFESPCKGLGWTTPAL